MYIAHEYGYGCYQNSSHDGGFGTFFLYVCWFAVMIFLPHDLAVWPRLWFLSGVVATLFIIRKAVKDNDESSFIEEIIFGFKIPHGVGILFDIFIGPFGALRLLFSDNVSYKVDFKNRKPLEIINRRESYGMHMDTANEFTGKEMRGVTDCSKEISTKLNDLSETVTNKTLATCRNTVVVATVTGAVVSNTHAQQTLPKIQIGNGSLSLYGWVAEEYIKERESDTLQLKHMRLRGELEYPNSFGAFAELELAHLDDPNDNWLRQAYISYDINDKWQLKVGRLNLAGIYVHPPPFLLETVKYPRSPFPAYAYGVQAKGEFRNDWSLIAGIGGTSDLAFDEKGQFRQMEFSSRLEKSIKSLNLTFAGTTHLSRDSTILGFDISYKPTPRWLFKGVLYNTRDSEEESATVGGQVMAEVNISELLSFHSQIDIEHPADKKLNTDDMILTNGIEIKTKDSQWSFTVDHEAHFDNGYDKDNSKILFRFQFRF